MRVSVEDVVAVTRWITLSEDLVRDEIDEAIDDGRPLLGAVDSASPAVEARQGPMTVRDCHSSPEPEPGNVFREPAH